MTKWQIEEASVHWGRGVTFGGGKVVEQLNSPHPHPRSLLGLPFKS